jgi:hypothetical protein
MTGTDLCVNKPHKSRSYLNHLLYTDALHLQQWVRYYDTKALQHFIRDFRTICGCGNEPSGSIKCGEFLDYLKTY